MDQKPFFVTSHDMRTDDEYKEWLQDVKERYRKSQIRAAVRINAEQLVFNWSLGRDLVMRKAEEKWGKGVVEQISLDLQDAFPGAKGFSTTNLWYMKKWYLFYTDKERGEKLQQLVGETEKNLRKESVSSLPYEKLQQTIGETDFPSIFSFVPWGQHITIITRCKSVEEAFFYIANTIKNGWSRSALENSIAADFYNKAGKAVTNFKTRLPYPDSKIAQELTKENYDLGFISLPVDYDEKELEDEIEHHITRFLLELGKGWAFLGRQKEIVVAGSTRKIDLLFYHIRFRFYMVVELKAKKFQPEFAGKLNFYVNAVNELLRTEDENPTIGLLICKDMDKTEVQWALQGINTPMGVATYENVKVKEIQDQLPTTDDIKAVVKNAEEEYLRKKDT